MFTELWELCGSCHNNAKQWWPAHGTHNHRKARGAGSFQWGLCLGDCRLHAVWKDKLPMGHQCTGLNLAHHTHADHVWPQGHPWLRAGFLWTSRPHSPNCQLLKQGWREQPQRTDRHQTCLGIQQHCSFPTSWEHSRCTQGSHRGRKSWGSTGHGRTRAPRPAASWVRCQELWAICCRC